MTVSLFYVMYLKNDLVCVHCRVHSRFEFKVEYANSNSNSSLSFFISLIKIINESIENITFLIFKVCIFKIFSQKVAKSIKKLFLYLNIKWENNFYYRHCFITSIVKTFYLLKLCPIFIGFLHYFYKRYDNKLMVHIWSVAKVALIFDCLTWDSNIELTLKCTRGKNVPRYIWHNMIFLRTCPEYWCGFRNALDGGIVLVVSHIGRNIKVFSLCFKNKIEATSILNLAVLKQL